jgi:hypothetical protein
MKAMGSEDCLHLAVFTPEVCTDDIPDIGQEEAVQDTYEDKGARAFHIGLSILFKGTGT